MAEYGMWRDQRHSNYPHRDDDRGRRRAQGGRFDESRSFGERRMDTGGGVFGTSDYDGDWRRDGRDRDRGERSGRWAGGDGRYGRRDNDRFDNSDEDRRIPRNETSRLIASDKVEGTKVFGRDGERLGTIENFMVDKRSGRVEYAVMSFGGFMGAGERHYPVPWDQLTYDERCGGYRVDMDERDLDRAPSHRRGEQPRFEGRYGEDIHGYYMGW